MFSSPNHCGRHLGKINGHNSTYVKIWRCTFGRITRVLWENLWENCCNAKLRCLSGLPSRKNSGNCRFNSIKDRPTCHRSLFQAYKFGFWSTRTQVTSYPSQLVPFFCQLVPKSTRTLVNSYPSKLVPFLKHGYYGSVCYGCV